jgi:hypothetical protein
VSFGKGAVSTVESYWGQHRSLPRDWKSGIVQSDGLLIVRYPFKQYDWDWAPELGAFFHYYGPLDPYIRWAADPPPYLGDAKRKRYRNPPSAKGIDVHPDAKRLILKRNPTAAVFFCLEGCLKADAVFSAGFAACSVLGVTMWNDPDHLKRISPALRYDGRAVFVVSDSDWRTNPEVARQAVRCVRELRSRGANAWHVAPPDISATAKTGVDDFLAAGNSVLDLQFIPLPPETPFGEVAPTERANVLLEHLRSKDGPCVSFRPSEAPPTIGLSTNVAREALKDLSRAGLVSVTPGRFTEREPGKFGNEPHRVVLTDKLIGPCHPLSVCFDGIGLLGYKRGKADLQGPPPFTPIPCVVCVTCQNPFTPRRRGHVFCTSLCRSRNHRRAARASEPQAL